jgi:hypothetical protein
VITTNITEAFAVTIFTVISMPKMEAAGSSLTLASSYQSTRRHIPYNCNVNNHSHEVRPHIHFNAFPLRIVFTCETFGSILTEYCCVAELLHRSTVQCSHALS